MKTVLILAATVAAAIFVGPAAAAENNNANSATNSSASSSVCLRHGDVDGWGARDKHSMVVNDRFGRKYLVSLAGLCEDLDFAFGAGFRQPGLTMPGSCVDRGDRVVMRGGGVSPVGNNTCWVTKVQLYTKDMERADKLARENKQPLNAY